MLRNINKFKKFDVRNQSKLNETNIVLSTADSDFAPPDYILEHISKNILIGDFTYKRGRQIFEKSLIPFLSREKYTKKKVTDKNLFYSLGTVHLLQIAIETHTKENDYVLVPNPIYGPFIKIIKQMKRKPAFITIDGETGIDHSKLQQVVKNKNIKLFLFCNPQNPTSYVFEKKDLILIKDTIYKNKGHIYSDEVWSELIFDKEFTSFASLDTTENSRIVSINGLGKAFNLHSLNFAYGVSYNDKLLVKLEKVMRRSFASSHKNNLVLAAVEAAYDKKKMVPWINGYKKHIMENYNYVTNKFKATKIYVPKLNSTYILLLDFKKVKKTHEEIKNILVENGVILSDGKSFGSQGNKKFRILLSTSKDIFKKAVNLISSIKEFNE